MNLYLALTAPKLGRYERQLGKRMVPAYAKATRKVGEALVRELRRVTVEKGAVYKHRLYRGWRWERVAWDRIRVTNVAPHTIYVEMGRGKNKKMPPLKPIEEWCRDKLGDPGAAWPVARAIARRGIPPRRMITDRGFRRRAQKIVRKQVLLALRQAMREAASGL